MGLSGDATRSLLLAPEYWRPRLERLRRQPRQLAIFPRPDLGRPGIEVVELRMRAHDGMLLSVLLARSAFASTGLRVCLRTCADLAHPDLDWSRVEEGGSDLVFCHPEGRKLEDRVLDLVRIIDAACSMESVGEGAVTLQPSGSCVQDEFTIAEHIRNQGWLDEGSAD